MLDFTQDYERGGTSAITEQDDSIYERFYADLTIYSRRWCDIVQERKCFNEYMICEAGPCDLIEPPQWVVECAVRKFQTS